MTMRTHRGQLALLMTAIAGGLLALALQAAPAAAQSSCGVDNFAAAPCPSPSPSPTSSPTATPTPSATPTSTSSPTPTPSPSISPTPSPSPTGAGNSANAINGLADQRFNQMITNRVLGLVLLGVNEQVNCNDCISAFGSAGSFSAGIHGRKQLTNNLALLAGLAYTHYDENGYHVTSAPIGAFALRYDFVDWGSSRPFFDVGTILTPYERVRYGRSYATSLGNVTVDGTTTASNYAVYGRAGWISRLSPRDELAASVELWQLWQHVAGYRDPTVAFNPFDATIAGGTDRTSLVKVGGQWTHLFGTSIEANINGGYVQSFATSSGIVATVTGNGTVTPTMGNQGWFEYGGRLGFRLPQGWIADLFVNGTLGPQPVGNTIHGGIGLRVHY
ncbi:hypothetical protein [Bradyrhizobium sp. SZCCHNRI3052]|uniref:hypothetical protein n=1 Tax=Bradyrhizobium sp. SZCCHNRI3052 TaxID=3057295 RepID=UPI0029164FA9|nr:hypothetical protein [Bradyrhizobium sp. SZCCHNRI3052]